MTAGQEVLGEGRRHGPAPHSEAGGLGGFGVVGAGDVADHDQIRPPGQMRGVVAVEDRDAERGELVAHGGIDRLVRAAHLPAGGAVQAGERAHARTGDADQVDTTPRRRGAGHAAHRSTAS